MKIKRFFSGDKEKKRLDNAQEAFDDIMEKVDGDNLDLEKLEKYVHDEFDGIDGEVNKIEKKVDKVVTH